VITPEEEHEELILSRIKALWRKAKAFPELRYGRSKKKNWRRKVNS